MIINCKYQTQQIANTHFSNTITVSNNFVHFLRYALSIIDPSTEYKHNWHLDNIAYYLEQCRVGNIKRLIINVPPRSLKSVCINVAWSAWLLGHNPSEKIISASYSNLLSEKHSIDSRILMESPLYKAIFPDTKILSGEKRKSKFVTTSRGHRFATSVGGTVTGEGGNILIVDDPNKPADINSKKVRSSTIRWFEQDFVTRLNNKKDGVIIVIMQRLHQNDLSGYLLEKNKSNPEKWCHLNLPVINVGCDIIDETSNLYRERYTVLQPNREGVKEIERIKSELGSRSFMAQYQQCPEISEQPMLKKQWFKYYKKNDQFLQYIYQNGNKSNIVASLDSAIKTGCYNDYSVCTIWYVDWEAHILYLLDVVKEKLQYPQLKKRVLDIILSYKIQTLLIEDKASGQSLIQDLQAEKVLSCIIPIKVQHDKVSRFASASLLIETGLLYLPESQEWLVDYENELLSFPDTAHDDQVDSTSQMLNWAKHKMFNNQHVARFRRI